MTNRIFDFATAQRIIFGSGKINALSEIIDGLGKKALVIKGKSHPDPEILYKILEKADVQWSIFIIEREPDIQLLVDAVNFGRENAPDFVIGFGGGAPIDTGKAVATLLNNSGEVLDYLEVVGKGLPLQNASLPYIAIPTTAGTGSEVTRNAVFSVPEKQVKVSMRNAYLLPEVAIIDPQLMVSVPPQITASTGMDALTQVIEPYLTKTPNRIVDMFCQTGIPLAASNLFEAYSNGTNLNARENMAFVSLLGGLSLANAKLGAVHGFAGPIGGLFHAPHGMICAALLPAVMKVNAEVISTVVQDDQKLQRFEQIACWITGAKDASIEDGVTWISDLAKSMKIPGLKQFGISAQDYPAIIERSQHSSSMKGNPVELTPEQMVRILDLAL